MGEDIEKAKRWVRFNMMTKFEFLLGSWNLDYKIPKSIFSPGGTDSGKGTFRRALNDKYVYFDYTTKSGAEAHAIFAWDEKAKVYRYWWFENSGSYLTATCNFVNDQTLLLNWHDTLLIQTFTKVDPNKVILKMEHPNNEGKYEPVLEVTFTRV
jgi:hypothetical protein